MNKARLRLFLDFIPLVVLIVYAIILLVTISTANIVLQGEHYTGFAFLIFTTGLFFKKHKYGVLCLGLTITLGIFKLLSFSAAIEYHSFGGSINGYSSGDIKIQLVFILWLILHLLLSGRHYIGILTKKYWQDLINPLDISYSIIHTTPGVSLSCHSPYLKSFFLLHQSYFSIHKERI